MSNLVHILIFSCFSLSLYSQVVSQSIVDTLEAGVKVGSINGCGEGSFREEELLDATHKMSYAEAELRALIEKVKECAKQSRILQVDLNNQCRDERAAVNKQFFNLKKNGDRKKITLGCLTQNDNSPLFYISKKSKDQGTDEGATARHQCFLEYPTEGGRIVMRLENSLFTEFVDAWLSDIDANNDGKLDTELGQRALERTKLEILYEWIEKPGLKIAIGPYISRQVKGESFGTRLQNNWHELIGVHTYNEVTEKEDQWKKLGGGVTLEVEKTLLDRQRPFSQIKSTAFSKTDFGYEADNWLIDQKAGAEILARAYTSRHNSGGYMGVGTGIAVDHTTFGDSGNTALWQSFKIEAGYKSRTWEIGAYAAHSNNLLYDGPSLDGDEGGRGLFSNDHGQDQITTKSERRFEFGLKASASLDKSRNAKDRQRVKDMEIADLEISIEALEQEIDMITASQNTDLGAVVRKRSKLDKLARELIELRTSK